VNTLKGVMHAGFPNIDLDFGSWIYRHALRALFPIVDVSSSSPKIIGNECLFFQIY